MLLLILIFIIRFDCCLIADWCDPVLSNIFGKSWLLSHFLFIQSHDWCGVHGRTYRVGRVGRGPPQILWIFFTNLNFWPTQTEKGTEKDQNELVVNPLLRSTTPPGSRDGAAVDLPAGERPTGDGGRSLPLLLAGSRGQVDPRPFSSPGCRLARRRSISLLPTSSRALADLLLSPGRAARRLRPRPYCRLELDRHVRVRSPAFSGFVLVFFSGFSVCFWQYFSS